MTLTFLLTFVGVYETKITTSNDNRTRPSISSYVFEFVPTPLASWGVGLFIDELLDYKFIEKSSNEALQALWIEIFSSANKNIIRGIIYRHHNSPDVFPTDFEETIEKSSLTNKALYLLGDFNIDLLKCETFHFSHNLLLHLQNCYLIPTVDKLYEFTEP